MFLKNESLLLMLLHLLCVHLLLTRVEAFYTGGSTTRALSRVFSSSIIPPPPAGTEWDLSLRSPCKLNLFLRILGRRPTGYHDLASLFQAISLSDFMHFTKLPPSATRDELTCSDTSLAVDGSNLVVKALNLMRTKTGREAYFKVHLDKYVPMQAGLGGGSGNAATAMYAFNTLCDFPGSNEDLKLWSGDIGSDITFFFSSGTAYCTGRGEIVQPLPALPEWEQTTVHVFKPSEGLSTALVFKALKLDQTSKINPESLLDCFETKGALTSADDGRLVNDLEPPAFECAPLLAQIKAELLQEKKFAGVMMSGSGTSIYALAKKGTGKIESIDKVLKKFPTLRHFECEFVNKEDSVKAWFK